MNGHHSSDEKMKQIMDTETNGEDGTLKKKKKKRRRKRRKEMRNQMKNRHFIKKAFIGSAVFIQ